MTDEWRPLTEAEEAAMRPVPGGGLSSSWANRVFATLDAERATIAARDAELAKLREGLLRMRDEYATLAKLRATSRPGKLFYAYDGVRHELEKMLGFAPATKPEGEK